MLHAKHGCHRAEAAAGEPWELAPCHNHRFGCSFLLPRRHQAGEGLAVGAEQLTGSLLNSLLTQVKARLFRFRASARQTRNRGKQLLKQQDCLQEAERKQKRLQTISSFLFRSFTAKHANSMVRNGRQRKGKKQPWLSLKGKAELITPLLSERCFKAAGGSSPNRAPKATTVEAFKRCETRLPDLSAAIPRGRR